MRCYINDSDARNDYYTVGRHGYKMPTKQWDLDVWNYIIQWENLLIRNAYNTVWWFRCKKYPAYKEKIYQLEISIIDWDEWEIKCNAHYTVKRFANKMPIIQWKD